MGSFDPEPLAGIGTLDYAPYKVHIWMVRAWLKRVPALFYRTEAGNEPVREFLTAQDREDRRLIGRDIAKVEYGWPVGMPVSKALGEGLHEVRTDLRSRRISRVFFYISAAEELVLLHAIIKKTQKTPPAELAVARDRMRKHKAAAKAAKRERGARR